MAKAQHRMKHSDFLVGPVVENPPSNARDMGLIPGQGTKIPHAMRSIQPKINLLF